MIVHSTLSSRSSTVAYAAVLKDGNVEIIDVNRYLSTCALGLRFVYDNKTNRVRVGLERETESEVLRDGHEFELRDSLLFECRPRKLALYEVSLAASPKSAEREIMQTIAVTAFLRSLGHGEPVSAA